jgi:hypothetical protein
MINDGRGERNYGLRGREKASLEHAFLLCYGARKNGEKRGFVRIFRVLVGFFLCRRKVGFWAKNGVFGEFRM